MERKSRDDKMLNFYTENSHKCGKCGHTQFLGKQDKIICDWCKNYIFKNKKDEFMYRMGLKNEMSNKKK